MPASDRDPSLLNQRSWSPEEDRLLTELYESGASWETIESKLPHRSFASIRRRVRVLGLRRPVRAWGPDEDAAIRRWYPSGDWKELRAALPRRSRSAIHARAQELGVQSATGRGKAWPDEQVRLLRESYTTMSLAEVQKLFPGRSIRSIRHKASRLGLPAAWKLQHPSPSVNRTYFRTLTPESCYWAGFLAADGWVHIDPRYGYKSLGVAIQAGDRHHLERFCRAIGYTGKIWERSLLQKEIMGRRCTAPSHLVEVRIYNAAELVDDLAASFNITPRKSLTLEPPVHLTGVLALAFIAGLIDGDGYVSVREGKPILGIAGTRPMLDWVKWHFDRIAPPQRGSRVAGVHQFPNGRHWTYRVVNHRVIRIAESLMALGVPLLQRKWGQLAPFLNDGDFDRHQGSPQRMMLSIG